MLWDGEKPGFRDNSNRRRSGTQGTPRSPRRIPSPVGILAFHGLHEASRGRLCTVTDSGADITRLLKAAGSGSKADLDQLMACIYNDLHRLAVSHLQRERADHTLQPTALVHEAYLKLIDQRSANYQDRLHFFAVAARIIRRLLVDHARAKNAQKRGGDSNRVPLEGVEAVLLVDGVELVDLDDALGDLARLSERQASVVELRFFAGCTLDEIAEILDVTRRTVDRDWRVARAWLYDRLRGDERESDDG